MGMGNGNHKQRITLRRITPVAILASALLLSTACQRQDPTPGASPQSETTQTTNPATRAARKSDDPNLRTANNKSAPRATPAPNPALRRIRGLAYTPDGAPIKSGKATLWEEDKSPDSPFKWKYSRHVEIASDGKFHVETTFPGQLALSVRADQYAISTRKIDREELDRKKSTALNLRFPLQASSEMRGAIWNEDASPVQDAEILFISRNSDGANVQEFRTSSTAEGRFSLANAPEGRGSLLIRSGNLPWQSFTVTAPSQDTSITLSRAVAVKGQLIGKDFSLGETTATITIKGDITGLKSLRHVVTDTNQRFDLGLLPARELYAEITANPPEVWFPLQGQSILNRSRSFTLLLNNENSTTVEILMKRGRDVSGTVMDASTSKPLAGIMIYPDDDALKEKRNGVLTDANGEFLLKDMISARSLEVDSNDYYVTSNLRRSLDKDESTSIVIAMERKVWLSGRVTDPMGNATGNVELSSEEMMGRSRMGSPQWSTVNDLGEFRFSVIPNKDYNLVAMSSLYALGENMVKVKFEDINNIQVPLTYGMEIRGKVIDNKNVPLSDIPVGILRMRNDSVVSYEHDEYLKNSLDFTQSDAEGRFSFKQVPVCEGIAVMAESHRFAYPAYQLLKADAATSEIILQLPETITVRGKVVDSEGNPVKRPNVQVSARINSARVLRSESGNELGDFKLPNSPTNTTASIDVSAKGFQSYSEQIMLKDEPLSITLTRQSNQSIVLLCRDMQTRQPISKAKITVLDFSGSGSDPKVQETSEPGRYVVNDIKVSPMIEIECTVPGYKSTSKTVLPSDQVNEPIVLLMRKKSSKMIGRAIMADTRLSVAGAKIMKTYSSEESIGESGSDGRFEILEEGNYSLSTGEAKSSAFDASGDGQEITDLGDIEMEGKRELHIKVVEGDSGKPVAGAKVTVRSEEMELNENGSTDQQGRFAIKVFRQADIKINLPEWEVSQNLSGRGNGYLTIGRDWEVIIPVGSAKIRGRVLRKNEPVWGVHVYAVYEGMGRSPHTTSGQDGSFELTNLIAGDWKVIAFDSQRQDFVKTDVKISSVKSIVEKDMELAVGKKVIGTIYNSEGVPVSKADVRFKMEMGGQTQTSNADGSYKIDTVMPGPFSISASHPKEGTSALISLDNSDEPGDTTRVDLILEKGTGSIECAALSAENGSNLSQYSLELKGENGSTIDRDSRMESGASIVVRDLIAGNYTAKVSSSGYAPATQSIQVQDGQTAQISVSLTPASNVTIRVINSRGYSVPDASVTLTGGATGSRTEKTDKQGIAKFEGVEPGTYNASSAAPDGKTAQGSFTINKQSQTQFELLLP